MKTRTTYAQGFMLRTLMRPLGGITFCVVLLAATGAAIAQGPPGHGGVPPGQAKKYDQGRDNRGGHRDDRHDDWRFQNNDRNQFYSHYRRDADRWRGNKRRPVFVRGQAIPRGYRVQPVPQTYWQGAPPPPPGYQYGYYGGYVVAYNPTTRIIADVLDLVTSAANR